MTSSPRRGTVPSMDALIAIREADGTFSHNDPGIRPLYSITKTYIAATVMRLGIDLRRPAADWIDKDWLPRGRDITVEQLLNHTSGVRDYGGCPEYHLAVAAGDPAWDDETFAEHTLRRPLLFEPGAGWAYSNPGYWLLTQIIEREAGMELAAVLRCLIFEPLQLTHTRLAHGLIESNLRNYDSAWVWHRTLMASALETATFMASDLTTPLRGRSTSVNVTDSLTRDARYGLGVMIENGEHFGHLGGGPGMITCCFHFPKTGRTCCALVREASAATVMAHVVALGGGDGEQIANDIPF